jgi:starvation-inducible DNA-binding protein
VCGPQHRARSTGQAQASSIDQAHTGNTQRRLSGRTGLGISLRHEGKTATKAFTPFDHPKESNMAQNNKLENQSVSNQLSTPTDLKTEGVAKIVATLNPLIADSLALYIKTKNFHWHLSGMHFRDLHLMFDEQAEQLFASVDPLAERVRKLGGTTLRSIGHIAQTQTIKDDNEDFVTPLEMLERLLKDNKQMAASQRAAHEVCDDHRDYATSSLLEVSIDETERRIWFLFETLQNVDQRG